MKKLLTLLLTLSGSIAHAQSWVNTGSAGFSASTASYTSLAFNGATPYLAYYDASIAKATVKKYDGASWVTVGAAAISAGQGFNNSIAFNGATPYTAYSDFSFSSKACVKSFNGTSWVSVGALGFSAGATSYNNLVFSGTTPYVVYQDAANANKATVMKFDGTNWVNVGAAGFSAGQANYTSLAFSGTTPYVAYVDIANGTKASVMKFDGTNWVNVGNAGFSAGQVDFTSLAFIGTTPYVGFRDVANSNKSTVMKFDGTNWVVVGAAGFSTGSCNYVSLAMNGTTPYIAYRDDANGGPMTVKKFNGTSWVTVGAVAFSAGLSNYCSLAFSGSTPFVAYQDGGNANKATVMQFGTSATGLNFDGVNDYIDCGNSPGINNLGLSGFTLEAWVNLPDPSAVNSIVRKTGDYNLYVYLSNVYVEYWPNGVGNSSFKRLAGTITINANTWTHVAATWNGTTASLYVNGVLNNGAAFSTTVGGSENLWLGRSSIYGNQLNGSLDEVRIWNRPLVQSEIQNNMNCSLSPLNQTGLQALYHFDQGFILADNSTVTTLTDASGNNNTGTLNNFALTATTSNWVSGNVTTSCSAAATGLNFDGVNDYISSGVNPALNLTSSLSVEAWINRSILGTDDCIIGKDTFATGTGYSFWVYQNNKMLLRFGNREYMSLASIPANSWTHVAATYNVTGGVLKLYINGVLDNTFTAVAPPIANTGGLYIGTPQDAVGVVNFAFSGGMDEVRIWNRVLCQGELQNNMNCELNAVGQSGLLALYHFNHGIIGLTNAGVITATDASTGNSNGTLINFALTGTTSNWIAGIATGNCGSFVPTGLAGTAGGAQVCQTATVQAPGTMYLDGSCNFIATVNPSGVSPVAGTVNSCVKIDATVQTYNGQPYVQRHYDIEPAAGAATATGTVTLYYTQADFNAYNLVRGTFPALPTGSADAAGISKLIITQFHGTGTAPGNYSGASVVINPADANIVWNGTLSRWQVTFDVSGFSGFYVHTNNINAPLPITLLSFTGKANGNNNVLEWITANEINNKEFVLERSQDISSFKDIATVSAKGAASNRYLYNDMDNLQGIVYYRLRIVDNNGRLTYSNAVALTNRPTGIVTVYPNPVKEKATLQIGDKTLTGTTAKIIDVSGKTVQTILITNSFVVVDMSKLCSGIYILQTVNGDAQKIIKQ